MVAATADTNSSVSSSSWCSMARRSDDTVSFEVVERGDQRRQLVDVQLGEAAVPVRRAQLVELLGARVAAPVLHGPRWTARTSEQPIGQHVAQTLLAINVVVAAAAALVELGAGQVGAALGDPTHVGDGVVGVLQDVAPLAKVLDVHQHPPDTGGSTATSSPGPTRVASSAASPLTQMRHVSSTSTKRGPYRCRATPSTSATVDPGRSSWLVPAASLADANIRTIATVDAAYGRAGGLRRLGRPR